MQIPSVTNKDEPPQSDLLLSLNEAPKSMSDLDLLKTGSEMMLIEGDDNIGDDHFMDMLDESPEPKPSHFKQRRNSREQTPTLFACIPKESSGEASPEDVNFFS